MDAIEVFIDKLYKILSYHSNILVGNGLDLLELDMNEFTPDTYFISDMSIERGKMMLIKDEELKLDLYKFCQQHKDRVFKGTKGTKEIDPHFHPLFYNGTKLICKEENMPPDGKWLYWLDKYGRVEKARMKIDAQDHFYPNTKTIKESDVIGWAYTIEKADKEG